MSPRLVRCHLGASVKIVELNQGVCMGKEIAYFVKIYPSDGILSLSTSSTRKARLSGPAQQPPFCTGLASVACNPLYKARAMTLSKREINEALGAPDQAACMHEHSKIIA